ncbi:hypothetical protein [Thermomonospora cellulosilytica]|uniref:Uncharacterized protein n=1 Tax=Thermomonospora cellulosilytica TaxID=1411118 RepID=A0A7W3MYJ6_9ACTN|nr:hypothetical protein [Thermomonospora cellulosilytica]MBA9004238.1 hypothetical protein [Thermomonospora cellulosilytica]
MPLPSTRKATTAQRPGGFREHTLELGQPAADSLTGIQTLARQLVPG